MPLWPYRLKQGLPLRSPVFVKKPFSGLTTDQYISPPVATASTISGFALGPNDIVGTSFESESAVGDIFTGGANAVVNFSTANPRTGVRHIRAALVGAADSLLNFPASTRQFTARFSIYLSALPTGNSRIFTIDGPVGVSRLFLPASGNLVTQIGGTSGTNVATLVAGTLYVIDVSFDGTTSTFQWNVRVNGGTTQTQSLAAQTPADIVDLDFWSTWIGTTNFDLDDLHITNSAADYPLSDMSSSGGVPGIQLTVPPGASTASVSSLVPTVTGGTSDQTVSPPAATASASAPIPSVQLQVSPAAATASASAPVPVPQLRVSPAAATASSSAPVPTVAANTTVSAPAATASASAPVPVPQLRVSPAAATASASAPVPTIQVSIVVPVATASANGPPPVPQDRVLPPAATASASALVPVPQLRVNVPTKGSIVLGYSNQLLVGTAAQDAERLIGRTFNGLRQNQNISVTSWSFASGEYALGRRLTYRSVEISTGTWSDVTAGTHDTELLAIGSNLVATGLWSPSNPAYICFHHEATLGSNSVFGTGQDYINAYRHVVDLWDANGYTAVKKDGTANGGPIVMVLVHFERAFTNTLELGGSETPPAGLAHADFDPDGGSSPAPGGTTYYSGIGIDGYNSITSPGHLKYGTTASNLFAGMVAQAAATGKFTFIGEFGCDDGTTTTDHTNKADWIDSCRAYFKTLVGTQQQLRALLLTIKSSAENFNVDSSPQATAAFQRLGLDPDFYPAYATGFGFNPTLPITVPVATASASALVPTVTATGANQTVSPPAATASASAPVPVPQLRVSPAAATANASAPIPTVAADSKVSPPAATASASAPVPVPQLKVLPPAATASASALIPTVTAGAANQNVNAPAATATASGPVPVPQLQVPPAVATASASALAPVPQLRVSPPAATANASAPIPTLALQVSAPVATASASAPTPTLQDRVLPPVATASASAPVPTVQIRLSPPTASSSASAPTPVPQVKVIVPAATASASAPFPTVGGIVNQVVLPPVATASASAKVPAVGVAPPNATASALAPVPNIRVVMIQWPSHSGNQWPPDSNGRWGSGTNPQWGNTPNLQWPPDSNERW